MIAENEDSSAPDPGLGALVAVLRYHGIGVDPGQIRHRLGARAIGIPEILHCAKEVGVKARVVSPRWERLAKTPMPAIATLNDGRFLILGKVG